MGWKRQERSIPKWEMVRKPVRGRGVGSTLASVESRYLDSVRAPISPQSGGVPPMTPTAYIVGEKK